MLGRLRPFVGIALSVAVWSSSLVAAPSAPTGLVASVTGSVVTLNWTPPPGTVVTGYRLEAGLAPGASNAANLVIGSTASYTATGVPAGTYFVRVRAIAADGESLPSNEATVVVGGSNAGCPGVPNAPAAVTAAVDGSLVTLSWAPSAGCPPTNYILQAGSAPGASDIAVVGVGAALGFSATAPNGTYFVRLVASNAYGASAPSIEVRLDVGASAPPPGGTVEVNLATASISAGPSGETVLIGEVVNRSAQTVAFTRVTGSVRDGSGAALGSNTTFLRAVSRAVGSVITDTTLAPNEAGCFYLTINVPRASVGGASFTVAADPVTTRDLLGRPEVVGTPAISSVGGRVRVDGQVRNNGAVTTSLTRAVFFILRTDSLATGCDLTLLATARPNSALAPGETGLIGATTHAISPPRAMRTWTQWEETPAASLDPRTSAAMAAIAGGQVVGQSDLHRLWDAVEAAREQSYRTQR